jgi:hypothetical protein
LGAPIVRSKAGEHCSEEDFVQRNSITDSPRARADAIFDVCLNRLDHGCGSQYYIKQPQITKASTACPFPSHICYETPNTTNAFEIIRSNITSYELGANSPSKLALSHRLTCAPIRLEPFLVINSQHTPPSSANISMLNPEFQFDSDFLDDFRRTLSKPLRTLNGPNAWSNESSGLRMSLEDGKQDLTILPISPMLNKYQPNTSQLIHPDLQIDGAETFLIIHRPGNSEFSTSGPMAFVQVDDPFFASHTRRPVDSYRYDEWLGGRLFDPPYLENHRPYYPDREATALGCIEQFQLCVFATGRCTSWEMYSKQFRESMESLLLQEQVNLSQEPCKLAVFHLREHLPSPMLPHR